MTDTGAIFRIENVSKRYGATVALQNANLAVRAGSIHAVLGENGAGKSTLMKIMAGVIAPNEGRMLLDDREVRFATPTRATAAGVICVFQELSLIPDLSVAENILLANPPRRLGMIDARAQRRLAEEALTRAGAPDIHPSVLVRDLPLSRKQMVEIAKALARRPRILILDEATSALSQADVRTVFEVLKRLRAEGISLLYISHRMSEIEELADECTVFRNGRSIESFAAGARSRQQTIEMMIGREYKHVFPPKPATAPQAAPALTARGLNWGDQLNGINSRSAPRRNRRSRRSRRSGTARTAARAVRRVAPMVRLDRRRRQAGSPQRSARGEGRGGRHGADPGGPQVRRADAADVGRREPDDGRPGTRLAFRRHRFEQRSASTSPSC